MMVLGQDDPACTEPSTLALRMRNARKQISTNNDVESGASRTALRGEEASDENQFTPSVMWCRQVRGLFLGKTPGNDLGETWMFLHLFQMRGKGKFCVHLECLFPSEGLLDPRWILLVFTFGFLPTLQN